MPFFGKTASFPIGPFRIAQASGAPIFPVFVLQEDDGRYRTIVEEAIRVPTRAASAADAAVSTRLARSSLRWRRPSATIRRSGTSSRGSGRARSETRRGRDARGTRRRRSPRRVRSLPACGRAGRRRAGPQGRDARRGPQARPILGRARRAARLGKRHPRRTIRGSALRPRSRVRPPDAPVDPLAGDAPRHAFHRADPRRRQALLHPAALRVPAALAAGRNPARTSSSRSRASRTATSPCRPTPGGTRGGGC